jgi:hypothetical protein
MFAQRHLKLSDRRPTSRRATRWAAGLAIASVVFRVVENRQSRCVGLRLWVMAVVVAHDQRRGEVPFNSRRQVVADLDRRPADVREVSNRRRRPLVQYGCAARRLEGRAVHGDPPTAARWGPGR